ncbi:uncharacterized protein HMPREF1541_05014 [Cyphellophora europaea CBS 101466]|uniref:3-phytase n=1 Tax=Cyphellophora europaea (strain CBS 101466) TaxID=1220924 RepID=W2RYH2_CYPE1|nr:uncharacterized protein HMPREF1541_05014 [Cyphellophora europaea CBS 101466]ETN40734.1 hypothetical protein HMPREF1541_05014 [Cyphellophora europaea CBS 101466]
MSVLRLLRRRTTWAYIVLAVSFLFLLGDRLFQLLSLASSAVPSPPTSEEAHNWNLFYHLGGNGPWIPKHTRGGTPDDALPDGCMVDQVHMMSRHGERYPTRNAGSRHLQLLDRLKAPDVSLQGALEFLNHWTYFTSQQDPAFENLTAEGPYAGTKQARDTGRKLRERYDHLVSAEKRVRFWSCDSGRDVETARYFADGFFGSDWESKGVAELEIIPEDADRGGDTLTPGDTCLRYVDDLVHGHDQGYGKLEAYQKHFTAPIITNLSKAAPGLEFSHLDVYSMMEMCGFEILARGSSPWCEIFTREEWLQFEYARDLLHFYRAGPGNEFSRTMGWLYLNATADLLMQPLSKDVYLSFVHDGDIVPLLAALRILDEDGKQELPTDRRSAGRRWKTSDVVPMGGRVLFERIACGHEQDSLQRFMRLSINDGIVSIPGLTTSPIVPYGVPVKDFWKFVEFKLTEYGEFPEVCGLPAGAASRITFLHQ